MTRSKYILALLVSLVALVALAPTASAADGTDRVRWNSVGANGIRYGSVDPNPVRHGSLELDRRHARSLPSKPRAGSVKPNPRATVIGLNSGRRVY